MYRPKEPRREIGVTYRHGVKIWPVPYQVGTRYVSDPQPPYIPGPPAQPNEIHYHRMRQRKYPEQPKIGRILSKRVDLKGILDKKFKFDEDGKVVEDISAGDAVPLASRYGKEFKPSAKDKIMITMVTKIGGKNVKLQGAYNALIRGPRDVEEAGNALEVIQEDAEMNPNDAARFEIIDELGNQKIPNAMNLLPDDMLNEAAAEVIRDADGNPLRYITKADIHTDEKGKPLDVGIWLEYNLSIASRQAQLMREMMNQNADAAAINARITKLLPAGVNGNNIQVKSARDMISKGGVRLDLWTNKLERVEEEEEKVVEEEKVEDVVENDEDDGIENIDAEAPESEFSDFYDPEEDWPEDDAGVKYDPDIPLRQVSDDNELETLEDIEDNPRYNSTDKLIDIGGRSYVQVYDTYEDKDIFLEYGEDPDEGDEGDEYESEEE